MAAAFQQFPQCEDRELCDSQKFEFQNEEPEATVGHPGFAALKKLKTKH